MNGMSHLNFMSQKHVRVKMQLKLQEEFGVIFMIFQKKTCKVI